MSQMKNKLSITIFLCLLAYRGFCQQAKPFEIIGDNIKTGQNIFLAEAHGIYELVPFKMALIKMALEKHAITEIVLEVGKAEAYMYNAYLQNGDTTIFIEYPDQATHNYMYMWKQLYQDHPFTIHGIDFERKEFVTAVLSILNKNEMAKNTELYNYLKILPDSLQNLQGGKSGYKLRTAIYSRAVNLFENNKDKLRNVLGGNYNILEDIFENPATEKGMEKRDVTMCENLQKIRNPNGKNFICILGIGHLSMHSKKSLLSRYISATGQSNNTIIQMVCKNCYVTSYYGSNELTKIMTDYNGKKEDVFYDISDRYCKPGYYSLVNQKEIKEFNGEYNPIPTFFIFFKDQPKQ